MAKVTVQAVYDQIRSILGDDQVSGGEVFVNTVLQPHYSTAYRALFRTMAVLGNPYVERDTFYTLTAGVVTLDPATAGITDMNEPLFVQYRTVGSVGQYCPMTALDRFDDLGTQTTGKYEYAWIGDIFQFRPHNVDLELRITYSASGDPPLTTGTVIGIDDSLDFLATHAAGLAIASRGGKDLANELLIRALGANKNEENPGGLLLSFLRNEIKRVQRIPPNLRRRQAFRRRVTNSNTLEAY